MTKATPGAGTSDWTINAVSTKGGENQGRLIVETGPAKTGRDDLLYSPAGTRLNDGKWHYVVWTRQKSGRKHLYIDGQLVQSADDSGGAITNDRPIQVGGESFHQGGRYLAGDIDELAIYGRA